MKVVQTKTATSPAAGKQESPFFNKAGPVDFFQPPSAEHVFFANTRSSQTVQAKLTVGKPNDLYERQADAVADRVVQRLAEKPKFNQEKPTSKRGGASLIQEKCDGCEKEENLQKRRDKNVQGDIISRKTIFESDGDNELQQKPALNSAGKKATAQPNSCDEPIQQKCAECEKEETLTKEKTTDAVEKKSLVQPLENTNEITRIQTKAAIAPLSKFQSQSSSISLLQPKCEECKQEETPDQKKDKEPAGGLQLRAAGTFAEDIGVQSRSAPQDAAPTKTTKPAITPKTEIAQRSCTECDKEKQTEETEEQEQDLQLKVVQDEGKTLGGEVNSEPSPLIKPKMHPPISNAVTTLQAKCSNCENEDLSNQEDERESDTEEGLQKKPVFDSQAENEEKVLQRSCRECEEGNEILRKPMDIQRDFSAAGSGSRESIVEKAKGELGKVEARQDDGTGKRIGAERLLEYFHVAAPGVWDDSIIENAGAQMPSWCGIFSVWAHKKAGKDIGDWQMGKGVSAFGTLTVTDSPQPGDIGYIDQPYQHHCIIEKIEGDIVFSIDGNSGLLSEVKQNQKPRSAYSGFFTAFGSSSALSQRKPDEKQVQQKTEEPHSTIPSDVESKLSAASGGQPLTEESRSSMEQQFGADFSGVRIHNDSSAVQMNKQLGAQAFTHGNDIYFNAGKYESSSNGQHLLAHELTHTIQQDASPQKSESSEPDELPAIQNAQNSQSSAQNDSATSDQAHSTIHESPQIQEVPAIQKSDEEPADAVYDALDGYTSSDDSFIVWNNFDSTSKYDTDAILESVASKSDSSITEVYEWMKNDMVAADWKLLLAHFVKVKAYLVERAIAIEVAELISGYTSEDDSNEILGILSGVSGDLLTDVLSQLEVEGDAGGRNETVEWFFDDIGNLAAYRLTLHFFGSGSTYAAEYAAYWTAYSVKEMISGFTGFEDSESILQRFERVPNDQMRTLVMYELELLCQEEWGETAAAALMDDMWQMHYLALRKLMPTLPIYNPQRSFLESAWDGVTDAAELLLGVIEYAVCGLLGVVVGVLSVVADIVVLVWDILVGATNVLGMILYFLSGESICRENKDNVYAFFRSLGEFFDAPGDSVSKMWDELVLEASLIEGPLKECQQAYFWTKRVANLIVNIVLIFLAGYGAVKLVLEGLEALVALVKSGQLLNALKALPGKLLTKIKGLPVGAANSTSRAVQSVVGMMRSPVETIGKVRTSITTVRLAAENEGYFQYLRQQAGKVVDKESTYWKERREFWKKDADSVETNLAPAEDKLTIAAETVVTDPANAEKLVKESDDAAKISQKQADDLLDEVKGNKEEKPPDKTPDEKPPVPKQPLVPKQVDYGGNDLSKMCIDERLKLGPRQIGPPKNIAGQTRANFAVFEYVQNGQVKHKVMKSKFFEGHSEKLIHEELQKMGIKPEQVTRIYTERAPCTSKGCSVLIRTHYPQAEVTYSFEFDADAASMKAGNEAHAAAVDNLFAPKTP